jgi:ribosome-binding protein aMBF1 (putative translation factor)
MIINGIEFFTVHELSKRLGIEPSVIKMRLHRAGVKPVSKDALYAEEALQILLETPGKGRPAKKSTGTEPAEPSKKTPKISQKTSKNGS